MGDVSLAVVTRPRDGAFRRRATAADKVRVTTARTPTFVSFPACERFRRPSGRVGRGGPDVEEVKLVPTAGSGNAAACIALHTHHHSLLRRHRRC